MSGFQPDWLDLREPADKAARDARLLEMARSIARKRPDLPVVDLGCGTGSTARTMDMPPTTSWRLVDLDPALLAIAADRVGPRACAVVADLSELSTLPLDGAGLVTGSALFDLVSADWVAHFVHRLAAVGAPLYAALTYDGRTEWTPAHPSDAAVLGAFNRHQRSDKGFGRALGPDAPACLATALEGVGYRVETAPSDWNLGSEQAPLTEELARGIAGAAIEAGLNGGEAGEWMAFRLSEARRGTVVVGHLDLLAWPRH